MGTHLSLVQAIGFCLVYIALSFLYPIVSISLNPFEAAPFWIVALALSILLIGLVFGLLAGLCWLLGTSVQKIGLLYPMEHAFLPKQVRYEYNQ